MPAFGLDIIISGTNRLQRSFNNITSEFRGGDLGERIGAIIVASTEARILFEKKTPDGDGWDPWSDAYARTRTSQHSLLVNEGDLSESISANVSGGTVEVGSDLIYAGAQNAQRQFLGLSREDDEAIADEMGEWLGDII